MVADWRGILMHLSLAWASWLGKCGACGVKFGLIAGKNGIWRQEYLHILCYISLYMKHFQKDVNRCSPYFHKLQ